MTAARRIHGRTVSPKEAPGELVPVGDGIRGSMVLGIGAGLGYWDLLEAVPDALLIVDRTGEIVIATALAEVMFGCSRSELVGQRVESLIPEPLRDGLHADWEGYFAPPSVRPTRVGLELSARRRDGVEFPVEISLRPRDTLEGLLVLATARDASERKRAAEGLPETDEPFRGAFEEAPIGMALADLDGRFDRVNRALCGIVGYDRAELEGMPFEAIVHPEDVGALSERLSALREGEERLYATERRYIHASGSSVWIALQITLIRDVRGRPRRLLLQSEDITERKRYESRLQDLADRDLLTGLVNRRSFARELHSHGERAARYGAQGALLMLDLDHFKYVNDAVGHLAGDALIVRVAEVLAGRLRESDVLARLGGDEFAVLLPKADLSDAELVASELLQALRDDSLEAGGATAGAITASVGIATFDAGLTGEDVLVDADLAMFDAKEAGRDRVAASKPRSTSRMKGRMGWIKRIRTALDEGGFSTLSQPIIDLSSGRVSQHELLLRMDDAHGDLIPPGMFLSIAERFGMIQEIDAWVVCHAIEMLAARTGPGAELPLEVNLSGRSLGDPKLLELIEHELARTGVPPERLIFEVTETAAVEHIGKAKRFADHLSKLGCRFALDDFGAGFGSFYYLKHLPFDYLKIDGEFVSHCRSSRTDRLVIEAVVGIARGLGKRTIAEFVGDQETLRLLTNLGVDYAQGYHLGRPTPTGDNGGAARRAQPPAWTGKWGLRSLKTSDRIPPIRRAESSEATPGGDSPVPASPPGPPGSNERRNLSKTRITL